MLKRHLPLLLVFVLLLQLVGTTVFAADSTETLPDPELSFEETAPFDDPEYYRNMASQEEDSLQSTFSDFSPRALAPSEALRKGVDVSYYQNTIDWKAVRADGIDFAIIRVGYRGYGSGQLVQDPRFEEYMQKALEAGLRVGVYIYSQAITPVEAVEEARFILDRIKDYNVQLPLVIDFEFAESSSGGYIGRLYNAELTKAQATEVCNAFIQTVTSAGYRGMTYANKFMLDKHLNPGSLKGSLWLAQYRSSPTYTGAYEFWQCSSSGEVDGIKGGADIDFWFENTSAMPFLDVSPNRWSYNSILTAYEKGLIFGITETQFSPTATTTRGQLVSMLYRMSGSPAVTGTCPFTDLTMDYYKPAITWAYQQGIVSGTSETTFSPNDPITRQDLVSILYRMKKPGDISGDISDYKDASSVSAYAKNAMIWGVSTGLLSGYEDNTLQPKGLATREQAAAFMVRYMNLK